jgi:hypothetical protein
MREHSRAQNLVVCRLVGAVCPDNASARSDWSEKFNVKRVVKLLVWE